MEGLLVGALSIVLVDIVLAGDNACVIAMAVRRLPRHQRLVGIILGAAAAVALRVSLTFVASHLIMMSYLKLVGGALVILIAIKLLQENALCVAGGKTAGSLLEAVKLIMVADVVMSTDNILAVAAVAKENHLLLVFGLGLSIPLVVGGSSFLCLILDRYPFSVYVAAAVLGKVGGELMITDPLVGRLLNPSPDVEWSVQLLFAVGVIIVAKWQMQRRWRPWTATQR